MFRHAGQGLHIPIAISTIITLVVEVIFNTFIRMKEAEVLGNRMKNLANISLDILYIMSANLVGGILLAKVPQSLESR